MPLIPCNTRARVVCVKRFRNGHESITRYPVEAWSADGRPMLAWGEELVPASSCFDPGICDWRLVSP